MADLGGLQSERSMKNGEYGVKPVLPPARKKKTATHVASLAGLAGLARGQLWEVDLEEKLWEVLMGHELLEVPHGQSQGKLSFCVVLELFRSVWVESKLLEHLEIHLPGLHASWHRASLARDLFRWLLHLRTAAPSFQICT